MKEYIERQNLLAKLPGIGDSKKLNREVVHLLIASKPAADVQEVRHGRNITSMNPVDEFMCSICGVIYNDFTEAVYDEDGDYTYYRECEFKYCPNCGARMDGEE